MLRLEILPHWVPNALPRHVKVMETVVYPDGTAFLAFSLKESGAEDLTGRRIIVAFSERTTVTPADMRLRFHAAGLTDLIEGHDGRFVAACVPAGHALDAADLSGDALSGAGLALARSDAPQYRKIPNVSNWDPRREPVVKDPLWQFLTSRPGLEKIIRNEVIPRHWPGGKLERLGRIESAYSPGEGGTSVISLRLQSGDDATEETVILAANTPDPKENENPSSAPITYEVEIFPDDSLISGLRESLNPGYIGGILEASGNANGHDWQSGTSTVLRYRAHERCVSLLTVPAPANDSARFICKAYDDPDTAKEVFHTLQAMRAQLGDPSLVVEPLALDPAKGLVVMEFVEGETLGELLDTAPDREQVESLVQLAARVLAQLHNVEIDIEAREKNEKTFSSEIIKLRDHAAAISPYLPSLAREMEVTLDGVRDAALQRLQPQPAGFVHGGFKPTQIIVRGEGKAATVLDFDGSSSGDPAIDVGRFMAKLRYDSLSIDGEKFVAMDEVFLRAYREASSRWVQGRERLFQGLALVRMASRRFETGGLNLRRSGGVQEISRLLAEARDCIAL